MDVELWTKVPTPSTPLSFEDVLVCGDCSVTATGGTGCKNSLWIALCKKENRERQQLGARLGLNHVHTTSLAWWRQWVQVQLQLFMVDFKENSSHHSCDPPMDQSNESLCDIVGTLGWHIRLLCGQYKYVWKMACKSIGQTIIQWIVTKSAALQAATIDPVHN